MKIIVRRTALANVLKLLDDLAAPKQMLEFWTGALLSLAGNQLSIRATDGGLWVETAVEVEPVDVSYPRIGLNGRLLAHLVDKLIDDEITISVKPPGATVESGDNSYRLSTFDPETFPKEPNLRNPTYNELPAAFFQHTASFLADIPEDNLVKPYLSGISLSSGKGRLRATATDSRRWAYYHWTSSSVPSGLSVILPVAAIRKVAQIAGDAEDPVAFAVSDAVVQFETRSAKVTCGLILGTYPPLHEWLPDKPLASIRVSKTHVTRAAERVLLFAKSQNAGTVTLGRSGTKIAMTETVPEIGSVFENIPVIAAEGPPFTVTVFARHILDAVKTPVEETIDITYYGPNAPIALTSAGVQFFYWMLPIAET